MNKIQTPKNWILHTPLSPHFQLWDRSVCRLPARVPNCWRQLIHIQTPLWYESNYTENYQRIAPVLQIFPSKFISSSGFGSKGEALRVYTTFSSWVFFFLGSHSCVVGYPIFFKTIVGKCGRGEKARDSGIGLAFFFIFDAFAFAFILKD